MRIKLKNSDIKFNFVKTRGKFTKGTFPDVLIVGPQRTGTTWLSEKLNEHDEVFMSYPKEIYFFSRLEEKNIFSMNFKYFINSKPIFNKFYFNALTKSIMIDFLQTTYLPANQLDWYLTFFNTSGINSIFRYLKFKKKNKKASQIKIYGEATASYFVLKEKIIEDILAINPEIKIIILIRNPISRSWSHAQKDLVLIPNKKASDLTFQDYKNFFSDSYMKECGEYTKHINKWERIIKKENLHIGHYDDLVENPKYFLNQTLKFLNINSTTILKNANLAEKVNPTSSVKIPDEIYAHLKELYGKEISKLEERYPNKIKY